MKTRRRIRKRTITFYERKYAVSPDVAPDGYVFADCPRESSIAIYSMDELYQGQGFLVRKHGEPCTRRNG